MYVHACMRACVCLCMHIQVLTHAHVKWENCEMYANYAPDQECIIAYYSVVRYIILYYIHSIVYYHT